MLYKEVVDLFKNGTSITIEDRKDSESPFNLFGEGTNFAISSETEVKLLELFYSYYKSKDYYVSYIMENDESGLEDVPAIVSYIETLKPAFRFKTSTFELVTCSRLFTNSLLFVFQDEGERVVGLIEPTFK